MELVDDVMKLRFEELVKLGIELGIYREEGEGKIDLTKEVGINFVNACLQDIFLQHCEELQYKRTREDYEKFCGTISKEELLNITLIGLHQLKYEQEQ